MKAAETIIAWNSITDKPSCHRIGPPGSIGIGPICKNDLDWTHPYICTGGAAYVHRRGMSGLAQQLAVMADWYRLVYCNGIEPYLAHLAFLEIKEYQTFIKYNGAGPDKGERGHDPNISYGRSIRTPLPEVKIVRQGEVVHFWPKECVVPIVTVKK